jgi:hypothetical protein
MKLLNGVCSCFCLQVYSYVIIIIIIIIIIYIVTDNLRSSDEMMHDKTITNRALALNTCCSIQNKAFTKLWTKCSHCNSTEKFPRLYLTMFEHFYVEFYGNLIFMLSM